MKLQPIQNVVGYQRDLHTTAVLSTDSVALENYKKLKKNRQAVVEDINNIKEELNDLKSMLNQILKAVNKSGEV